MQYVVYQGILSPRDKNDIGWREWSRHETKDAAIESAKPLGIARVDEVKTIWTSDERRKRKVIP